jgi:hypothetical protein
MRILYFEVEKRGSFTFKQIPRRHAHIDDKTTVAPVHKNVRKPNLTSQQRKDIIHALLLMVVPGDVQLK